MAAKNLGTDVVKSDPQKALHNTGSSAYGNFSTRGDKSEGSNQEYQAGSGAQKEWNSLPPSDPNDDVWGWGGGYGYGYGSYGGGSSGPSEAQKKAAANLGALTAYGQGAIEDKANQMGDVYNIADKGNDNLSDYQKAQIEKFAGAEWFSRYLKEQSTFAHLKDVLGNGNYGADILDLVSDMQRVHDANAVDVLESLEQNRVDVETDRLSSLQSNINARNEMAANTEAQLKSNAGDYAAQLNNIHPDLATGEEGDLGEVIDAEGRTLNLPDWLNDKWFEEHKVGPVEIPYVSNLTRPGAATELSMTKPSMKLDGSPSDILFDQWQGMLQSLKTNNGSAANKRYWDTLTKDYGHRIV